MEALGQPGGCDSGRNAPLAADVRLGWTDLFPFLRTEGALREFLMGMHGYGLISSPHVVSAFDLGRFHRLADLGGATGHLAIAACQRYPNLVRSSSISPGPSPSRGRSSEPPR